MTNLKEVYTYSISYVLYFIFITAFSIFSYLFIDVNLVYLKELYTGAAYTERLAVSIFYATFICIFFLFYVHFLIGARNKKLTYKSLQILIALSTPLLFSYPAMLSYDLFNYMATAKVLFHYHENPYLVMPIEFLNDPVLLYTRAANKYALYGPVWIILTGAPYAFSLGNFIAQVLWFKFLVFLFYLGTVYLIYKLSKNIFTVTFFALNPLILVEIFVSGHNDIVMMFFVFLSYFFVKQNKTVLSLIPFTVSIFIKFASVFLIPVWVYMVHKRITGKQLNWYRVWALSLIGMGIIFLLSPLREEMYPWYFIWIIPFAALLHRKYIILLTISFSLGLLMYYVPYMYTGYYILPLKIGFVVIFTLVFFIFSRFIPIFKKVWDF